MQTETLEALAYSTNPEFVELLTAVLYAILAIILVNISFLVGAEVGGRMQGYHGRGIELFMQEIDTLFEIILGADGD